MGRRGLSAALGRRCAGLAAAGLIALLCAGCGSRTPAFQVLTPAAPGGFQAASYPRAGVRLLIPRAWTVAPVQPPLAALVTSGPAVISLWRYHLLAGAPDSPGQLHQALSRLLASARTHSHGLRVLSDSILSVDGYPALDVKTVQSFGTGLREVNSTHVFERGRELVLEEYAPVPMFASLDRSVFSVVRRSLLALGP